MPSGSPTFVSGITSSSESYGATSTLPEIEGKVEGEEGIDETNEPLDTDNLTGDISYINIDPEN